MSKKITMKAIENEIKDLDVRQALERLYQIQDEHQLALDRLIGKYQKRKDVLEKERARFDQMCVFEKEAYSRGVQWIAGIDEAGRGPLAGPVVAAAVILPQDVFIEKLNDSKKLAPSKREELFDIIKEKALSIGVGIVNEKCIDEINILNATRKAMKIAVSSLEVKPQLLLVDSERLEDIPIEQIPIIKGDALSISIAAASIIAKVTRDRMIVEMDGQYPEYGFAKHKGYGTKEHIEAIKKYGLCPIHRESFTKNFTNRS